MQPLEQAHLGAAHSARIFDGIPAEAVTALTNGAERRRCSRGSVLVAEGDRPHEIFVIESGYADAYVADRHGQLHLVGSAGPGTTIGETAIIGGMPAAATVRAVSPMQFLVLRRRDFERFANAQPTVYKNISAMLEERLDRAGRVAANLQPGHAAVLHDEGAPPELAWAIACSVAWHSRASTLLLWLGPGLPEELAPYAHDRDRSSHVRAYLEWIDPAELKGKEALAEIVGELFNRFDFVLVVARGEGVTLEGARTLRLTAGRARPSGEGVVVSGWTKETRRRAPGHDGRVDVPAPADADRAAFTDGLLGQATPTGRAVGWPARYLAHLRVGLALGAGSVRGYAHIGVLKGLHRMGVVPDSVAGTSVGAAVAGLHALGLPPGEVARLLDRCGEVLFRPTVPVSGFLSNRALRRFLEGVGGGRRIEDLDVPLSLVAADIRTHREVVFRRGQLAFAVLASISIPGIYPALRVGEYLVVDGGVLNPVPASAAAEGGADVVIAVRIGTPGVEPDTLIEALEAPFAGRNSAVGVVLRAIELMQSRIDVPVTDTPVITLSPNLDSTGVGLHNFTQGRRFIAGGEASLEASLPRVYSALPWLRPGV